jgi:hypothetical protein
MAEIFGIDTGINAPSLVSSSFGGTLMLILGIIVVFFIGIIAILLYFNHKVYNKKIYDFENVSGQGWVLVQKDKARLIKVGDGGEEILYLRKRRTYRTAYGKKMGKNQYWFAKGQDGYFYNVVLGDLDAKMGMLDIEPIDRDMRYMHVAIRKNIEARYDKRTFMEKYGVMLILGVYFLIVVIAVWFMIDQIGVLMSEAQVTVQQSQKTQELILNALTKVDAVCSGGSGVTQLN